MNSVGAQLSDASLTFVVPVTLKEQARRGDLTWRDTADSATVLRLRFLLASFLSNFDQADLHEFLLVCPQAELSRIRRIVRELTRDTRFRVVPESEICADIVHAVDPVTGHIRGWYAQQLIKLAAARHVATPYYVTLDSDIVVLRRFDATSLIQDGRALCGVETLATYQKLYTPEFAQKEAAVKQRRVEAAAALLGAPRPDRNLGCYYSETPVVLHTGSVIALCDHLTAHHGRPWSRVLAQAEGWTEYTLYFQHLDATGRLDQVHAEAGQNSVLNLSASVWEKSGNYNHPRPYDREHFTDAERSAATGMFIAIQSWLPLASWLPQTGCTSLRDFYRRLGRDIGIALPTQSRLAGMAKWLYTFPSSIVKKAYR